MSIMFSKNVFLLESQNHIQPKTPIETLAMDRNNTTGKLLDQGNNKLNTCQSENELTLWWHSIIISIAHFLHFETKA